MKYGRGLYCSQVLTMLGMWACTAQGVDSAEEAPPESVEDGQAAVQAALAALPVAHVLHSTPDGLPRYLVGQLGKVSLPQLDDPMTSQAALRAGLGPAVAPFRIAADSLRVRRSHRDERGVRHLRLGLVVDGLDVIGGDLVAHVDGDGQVLGVNGAGRGDLSALPAAALSPAQASAQVGRDPRFLGLARSQPRLVYLITTEGQRHRAYQLVVQGQRGQDPVRDEVYVDASSGDIVADYPQIHFARSRRVYTSGNGSALPGTLRRSEGQAASTDVDVNAAYDNTGLAYDAYASFWGRDSYNNAGATMISSVHYLSNYCNAFWNGTQMVYGDGSGTSCKPLARSLDVTAHELTHGVTASESALVSSGETGGINESMSDIFAAFVEAWSDGGRTGTLTTSADTWLLGEDVFSTPLRYLCDPARDGSSADFWSSTVGNQGVYPAAGIGNLAFCLLSAGGTHPRGKSTINVPAQGLAKAIRILYKAQVDILTSTAKYADLRTAMEQAATGLGYDQATRNAVGCAWAAVNVGTAPASCGGTTPPPTDPVLTSGVPVSGLAGAKGSVRYWQLAVPAGRTSLTISIAGGTGDADLTVKAGAKPTATVNDCRPYLTGNSETCTFPNPAATTYWIMLEGFAAYSGVTLTGTVR